MDKPAKNIRTKTPIEEQMEHVAEVNREYKEWAINDDKGFRSTVLDKLDLIQRRIDSFIRIQCQRR